MNDRFDNLWNDFLEGELDDAGFGELRELLRAHPLLVGIATDRYQEHKMLGYLHRENEFSAEAFARFTVEKLPASGKIFAARTVQKLLPQITRPRANWWVPSIAAAALGLLAFTVFQRSGSPEEPLAPAAVARLILAEDCEWQPESAHLTEGQSLFAGSLALKSGSAVVRFEGGAELVITGDTRIELVTANAGRLDHGNVVVRAEDGAEGFILDTPASEFIDLGTEFTVSVQQSGKTKMQVLDGEVAADSNVITAGNAIIFESPDTKVGRETKADPDTPRFSEMLRRANPRERRDLMQVYEGFFLDEGVYSFEKILGGKGWAHPWRVRTGEEMRTSAATGCSGGMKIVHGRMNAPWPVRGGRLGALELPPSQHALVRQLAEPIDLSKDGYTFFSFMISDSNSAHPGSLQDLSLTLRSSESFHKGKLGFGWTRSRTPLVRSNGGLISRCTRAIPAGQTVLCVGKISASSSGLDKVQFRCYNSRDPVHFVEPAQWDVDSHRIDLSSKLDLLEIVSNNGSTVWIDEIRIGPTWRSVTPLDLDKF